MDETLTRVAIDLSGRPFLVFRTQFPWQKIGDFDTELVREFFQAFAGNLGMTLHVETLYGDNCHHIAEFELQRSGAGAARRRRHRSAAGGRDPFDQRRALKQQTFA